MGLNPYGVSGSTVPPPQAITSGQVTLTPPTAPGGQPVFTAVPPDKQKPIVPGQNPYTQASQQPAQSQPPPAQVPTGQEGILSGPGYHENFYKQYGQDLMKDPSSSEQLFAKGMEGSNPYYEYAQQEAIKAINDASAARLNQNSSYTMKQIGNTVANLRGQQALGLTNLAGQSDAARVGRYDATDRYSRGAQDSTENRVDRGARGYLDLARSQAGAVDNFYSNAGNISNKANMAAIEAALKEAGLSASEIQNLVNNALAAGGTVAKFTNPGGAGA